MTKTVDLDRIYTAPDADALSAEYDRVAEAYDEVLTEQHAWVMPEIIAGVAAWLLPRSARILDAACGTGLVADSLRRFGFSDLHGLDLSPGMLAVAARKGVYQSLAEAALGDPLPYADGAFDAFVVCGAFTPGHAPAQSLVELLRVTRPGGLALFSLRADVEQPDFEAAVGSLSAAGRWRLIAEGAAFQSLPKGEPHVRNRIFPFRLAD